MSNKPYMKLDPVVVRATLYGIFKLLPKAEHCEHKTCGYKDKKQSKTFWKDGWLKTVRIKGELAKCTFDRYSPCTTQELSDPNNKASVFAAIAVDYSAIAGYSDFPQISTGIFLHDLIEDKVKDTWFQHGPNESIQPNIQVPQNWIKPSDFKNLSDVLAGMKKEL